MKIAVIGSGIAGLYAAWRLTQLGHRVTMFERLASPGLAAHGFQLEHEGHTIQGDVPSRMFNAGLWPDVVRLYKELNIAYESVAVDQQYRTIGDDQGFGLTLPMAMLDRIAVLTDSRKRSVIAEVKRLRDEGLRQMQAGAIKGTFAEFLKVHGFGSPFTNEFLYPALSATVCTCSDAAIGNYPAEILLKGLEHITNPEGLHRVTEGSGEVVRRIVHSIEEVCCNANVIHVGQTQAGAVVRVDEVDRSFDVAFVATQANHVAGLCNELGPNDKAIFESFEYEDVRIDIHTDPQFMPPSRRDWATFNFLSCGSDNRNSRLPEKCSLNDGVVDGGSMCTVWLNRFHRQWPDVRPVFQTIKPLFTPATELLIQTLHLQRPVVDLKSQERWSGIASLNRRSVRLKFCGAYAVAGIPLLQSAVESADAAIATIEPAGLVGERSATHE